MKKTQDERTISWIYLAVSMASEHELADFNSISMLADGINHAIPTHKEMQTSISWLTLKGLVIKVGNKYTLTPKGKGDFQMASKEKSNLYGIWNKLEQIITNYS